MILGNDSIRGAPLCVGLAFNPRAANTGHKLPPPPVRRLAVQSRFQFRADVGVPRLNLSVYDF